MGDGRSILLSIDPRVHGQITAWLAGTEIGRPTTRTNTGEDPNAS
jgi:hypothetical protein